MRKEKVIENGLGIKNCPNYWMKQSVLLLALLEKHAFMNKGIGNCN